MLTLIGRTEELDQIYRNHENEKKRRVLDIEQGSFTPLVFTSTDGIGKECLRFHSRLAELVAAKKGESYSTTISWIRARTSFALLRSALVCLRGSNRGILVYNICLITIRNSVSDGATNKSVLNTESSFYD